MSTVREIKYALGIDLGVRSLGWAVIEQDAAGSPLRIVKAGVRCFEAGVEGNIEAGKDESRAAARRGPRQARRQTWRRAQRRRRVLRVLQKNGLLPDCELRTPQQIHQLISEQLDSALRRNYLTDGDKIGHHTLLYRLRAKALDEQLEPYELGRVFYHLAQRRGFLSNRKAQSRDEEEGQVRAAIGELATHIEQSGARTLGEYFSRLDPAVQRIRQRWTSRQMYRDEFERIWSSQSCANNKLTDEFKRELHEALFDQRSLKSQAHLIGRCSLMPGRRRAPLACRIAQRYRMVAAVNNLAFRTPGKLDEPLTVDQRRMLLDALDSGGDLTFANIRKILHTKSKFNLEEGGEKKIPGNRTESKLRPIFGSRWNELQEAERDSIIDVLLSLEDENDVERIARAKWGLNQDAARKLAEVRLEQDRAAFCREAMRRLLTHMENGIRYGEARKIEFPNSFRNEQVHDLLPPVVKALPELRNPAVARALSELRKVVNAIIRRWGKPQVVRVELARDLNNPRQKRKEAWEKNRDNERMRSDAATRIINEIPEYRGHSKEHIPRHLIEKVLLADECNWKCPFTGRGICMATLVGRNPEFDVEHILPFSKTLDNSYPNKTLCHVDENRHRKRNRTPYEAYHGTPEWDNIINRVKSFKGNMARAKLARFQLEKVDDDFTDAQLQDTRYAARLAGDYLGLLYGGRSDENRVLRVQVSPDQATAYLRNKRMLNSVLNDGGEKVRTNHKHHAVDAIAIALTTPAMVKRLCDAADKRFESGRRLFAPISKRWPVFLDDARREIRSINVSHRVKHKLSGALHKETNYSRPQRFVDAKGHTVEVRHVRKPVTALTKNDVDEIVDKRIRECVKAKLAEVGEPKKLEGNWPMLPTRDSRAIPIKKVRTRQRITVVPVGSNGSPRFVVPGANHHTVIVARKDKKGRVKWEDHPVTLLDAVKRKNAGQPVIQREWDGAEFVMSFMPGDSLMFCDKSGNERLYRCMSISEGDCEFRLDDDARTAEELKNAKARVRAGGDKLRQLNARKVKVSPLGEICPADD
jgi:CRISPR-associated endonuclease Csn1